MFIKINRCIASSASHALTEGQTAKESVLLKCAQICGAECLLAPNKRERPKRKRNEEELKL
jgi:hypothetical protein